MPCVGFEFVLRMCPCVPQVSICHLFFIPDPAATIEIHPDCIMKWVRSVVSDACASAVGVLLPEGEICMHEMRDLASF